LWTTLDIAHKMATQHVCDREGISHPSDLKWGKGWSFVEDEFLKGMFKVLQGGRGLIFTSHSTEKDIEDLVGEGASQMMTAPTASAQAIRFVRRYVDLILYYYYDEKGRRWLRVKGSRDVFAGSRIDGHFKGVAKFQAGDSPEEAYRRLVAAFNNQLQTKPKEITDGKESKQESRKRFRL
jgi:hypothetical protein